MTSQHMFNVTTRYYKNLQKSMIFLGLGVKKTTIGFDLAETLRNEAFELYLDVGFD